MAYYSLHAYDADVFIPSFLGLLEDGDGINGDIRFAVSEKNMETPCGVLQPKAADSVLSGEFASRVETLVQFYRRWYQGSGSKDWMIAASAGKLYYRQSNTESAWREIELPSGITAFKNNAWSTANYEINTEQGTVDVVLLSNGDDGMFMVVPPDKPTTYDDLSEQTHATLHTKTHMQLASAAWIIRTIDTKGYKFGVIERSSERIWGAAITGEPDMLMYSAPYNPTDWEQNEEIPEDGAGQIMQPTWDGDSFKALKQFGDQLIAFKENRVWRILGTDPGVYQFNEQFGGGASFYGTIVLDAEKIYIADMDGISTYDGMTVRPLMRQFTNPIWRTINRSAMNKMVAAVFKNRYYLSIPIGSSTVNNALVVLNLDDGTLLYYPDLSIENFMPTEDRLYATSSNLPGKILMIEYNSWETGKASGDATEWITPWMDFGRKTIQKGGFDFYFTPEVKDKPVTLHISIQTEKKTKTKDYVIQPLTAAERAAAKEHRQKRLHFGGAGRRFRVIIRSDAGVTDPWRLIGGIHMIVETDPD